jgi:hypothetical protein
LPSREAAVNVQMDAPVVQSERERPVRVAPEVRRPRPAVRAENPQPREEKEKIPAGKGELRIGASPLEGSVSVGSTDWGKVPVTRKGVQSGQYLVSVIAPDGKRRGVCQATVWPDKLTIVVYDFAKGTCQTK